MERIAGCVGDSLKSPPISFGPANDCAQVLKVLT
jgi:hypothetical protein